ncbi:hypothetical protein IKG60_00155 [Candidatus Saccharibacteria bacterium]|nr:hypothetical protein [Candidatus Saccharibacteria bacterium]
MGSTLNLLYDYAQDLECLIKKVDELSRKSVLRDKLSKFHTIESFCFENLSFSEIEYLISLSRILTDYGFSQTYESFESACLLLLADYDHTKEAVNMAVEKLKKSASRLYANETATDFLWKTREVSDPWALLVEMLSGSDGEAAARRKFYLKRIAELASPKSLISATLYDKSDEVALNLSPLRLEIDFIMNDGILPEILHTGKTDLH